MYKSVTTNHNKMAFTSTNPHHKHQLVKLLLLLLLLLLPSTTIAAAYNVTGAPSTCPEPPDRGGAFTVICNPYEFDPSYYPGAQDWALSVTLVPAVDHLSLCLKSPYGEDTGIELWLIHYSWCEIGLVDDCAACLKAAGEIIKQNCPNKIGAQAASVRCCGRYEQYPFCKVVGIS